MANEESVLRDLGLPTKYRKLSDINYYQLLRLDPGVDHGTDAVLRAASDQMKKLHKWTNTPQKAFVAEVERMVVKARAHLSDPLKRAEYRGAILASRGQTAAEAPPQPAEPQAQPERYDAFRAKVNRKALILKLKKIAILAAIIIGVVILFKVFGAKRIKEESSKYLDKAKQAASQAAEKAQKATEGAKKTVDNAFDNASK